MQLEQKENRKQKKKCRVVKSKVKRPSRKQFKLIFSKSNRFYQIERQNTYKAKVPFAIRKNNVDSVKENLSYENAFVVIEDNKKVRTYNRSNQFHTLIDKIERLILSPTININTRQGKAMMNIKRLYLFRLRTIRKTQNKIKMKNKGTLYQTKWIDKLSRIPNLHTENFSFKSQFDEFK